MLFSFSQVFLGSKYSKVVWVVLATSSNRDYVIDVIIKAASFFV